MKKKVMIFTGGYLPGVKGGGPIQSIKNLVDNLSDVFEFYIVTLDRDLGDIRPYKSVRINEWNEFNNAKVYYISKNKTTFKNIRDLINSKKPDTIYLNSFFSFRFSIIPIILNKLNLIKPLKLVIAPRGEFSKGALKLKSSKKGLYITVAQKLKLYSKENLYWHATSKFEKKAFREKFNVTNNIYVCQNFSANYANKYYSKEVTKSENKLKLIYLARVHPMKNLNYAIDLLKEFDNGDIEFDVYGPIEDKNYWNKCKEAINKLPSNVKVIYKGLLNHELVLKTFEQYHFFLFPTHGENFGHVISEALISGTPVITSDQTPWTELYDKNVGWDINLKDKEKFIEVLQRTLYMNEEEYEEISKNAFEYGKSSAQQEEKQKKMIKILS